MQGLQGPSPVDQVQGQPVQQLVIAGTGDCRHSEIVGIGNQPDAEVPLPDAVGNHPGGQGMVAASQPPGEFQPAALLVIEFRLIPAGQDDGESP